MKRVHLLGVGGSGMAPLAVLAAARGYQVSGADSKISSKKEKQLKEAGIALYSEADLPDNAQMVVYSSAISQTHPSRRLLRTRPGVIEIHRMDFLTHLLAGVPAQFAIAGTHGKTSTTSMTGWVLLELGFDPDIIAGGRPLYLDGGVRAGRGDVAVLETDESDGSFLRTQATLRLCLNIDSDHLEHYGTFEKLTEAFRVFMHEAVICVVNADDPVLLSIRPAGSITFGESELADFRGDFSEQGARMAVFEKGEETGFLELSVPGRHFATNALGAYALIRSAMKRGLLTDRPAGDVLRAFNRFPGVERRIELVGLPRGIHVYDDYGHHPTEIAAVLRALRSKVGSGRLIAVFQPHRYTRTQRLYEDFAESLRGADVVHIMPLYSSGEAPIAGVDSKLIASRLPQARLMESDGLPAVIAGAQKGDVIVCLGAGDISERLHAALNR